MKTKFDSILATSTLTFILLVVLTLVGGQLMAQEPIALRLGTTMTEAQTALARLPHLSKEATTSEISLHNEYLQASYRFTLGELESISIVRNYDSDNVANAALDGYLVYLGRINATLVPVIREEKYTVYYAMTEEAHYEIKLEGRSKKDYKFTVSIQSRIQLPDAPDNLEEFLNTAVASKAVAATAF
jgi:hypothetical protein